MDIFISDLKRSPKFIFGLIMLSIGIVLMKRANIGMNPWGVFHTGIENATGIPLGWVIQIVGILVLLLSIILIKTKVGLGTILNILVIGTIINLFEILFTYEPTVVLYQGILFTIGLFLITFGRSMYISSDLGPGPRDGLFVGISRITKFETKYIKPIIEAIVLLIGYLLGAIVGIGTVISVLLSGFMVNMFFKFFGFDSTKHYQNDVTLYFKQKANNQ